MISHCARSGICAHKVALTADTRITVNADVGFMGAKFKNLPIGGATVVIAIGADAGVRARPVPTTSLPSDEKSMA